MERSHPNLFIHGLLGGLVAGAVVAAWFFVADIITNQAFDTPARLAGAVLREDVSGPWPRLILVYSILHFGVFAALGLGAAVLLSLLDLEPGLLVGAAFGLGVLNAVHYVGLLVTGTNLLTIVPVASVVGANLLGGTAMMAYLHRALEAESPLGWRVLQGHPSLFEGVTTGVVGAVAVAFWFLLVDLAAGVPFRTPAALGSAILLGATGPADVQLNLGVIVTYSFAHLVVFLLLGVTFVWLARSAAQPTAFWTRAVVLLVLLEVLFLGSMFVMSAWIVEHLGWLVILVANVLAIMSMGLWILRHRARALQHA
jgi:hypothetical protein